MTKVECVVRKQSQSPWKHLSPPQTTHTWQPKQRGLPRFHSAGITRHTKQLTPRQFIQSRAEVTGNQVFNYTSVLKAATLRVKDIHSLSDVYSGAFTPSFNIIFLIHQNLFVAVLQKLLWVFSFVRQVRHKRSAFIWFYCLDMSNIDILIRFSEFGGAAPPCREGMWFKNKCCTKPIDCKTSNDEPDQNIDARHV